MSKCGIKLNWNCTETCKSVQHSTNLIAAITQKSLTDKQIASYLCETCCNFAKIQDDYGRTTLHMAASCGRLDLCLWLAVVAGADVNAKDWESGYTALQRSIFYGNIDVAVRLIEIGADSTLLDKEDYSPIELVTLQRLPEVKIPSELPSQLYVWGSNLNFTLGIGTDDSIKQPDLLDYFKRNCISVKQVCTDEYHSVFVSTIGQVWVCGHGQGGRLGIYKEKPLLIPTHLAISNEECTMAATALNHTILLLSNGFIIAFGANHHHQLGVTPHVEACLRPRHVNLSGVRNAAPISGICAAKYHSVFFNENVLLVCGLNAGQLGPKSDSPYITVPQLIPVKDKLPLKIKSVATSLGSIVYALNNGNVFIVHRFQFKKIASRLLGIEKISAFGGHLSSDIISEVGEDLKVLILTTKGTIIFWEESVPHLMKGSFGLKRTIVISDIHLNECSILCTTVDGEAFECTVKDKEPSKSQDDTRKRHSGSYPKDEKVKGQEKLGKCLVSAKRIPYIHRAMAITSDPKGKNFAVIQAHPNNSIEICLDRSTSEMMENLKYLFLEATEDDAVHDVVFNINGTRIAAHRYVLAVNGFPFSILFNNGHKNGKLEIFVNDADLTIFKEFLMFLYTGHCQLLNTGPCNLRLVIQDEDPLKLLSVLAKKYNITALLDRLKTLSYDNGHIMSTTCYNNPEIIRMQRKLFPEFHDVELKPENGKTIKAHKCVLSARLPYFNSMFLKGWSETNKAQTIHLQTTSLIAEAFLDFLYMDDFPDYFSCDDIDNIVRLLILSDQLLMNQLKEACEILLAKSINLKNCVTILQVCNIYNTSKLKEPVLRFIVSNLNAILESRILESLDDKTLSELSEFYKRCNKCDSRIITPYYNAPSVAEILAACKSLPASAGTFFILPEYIKDACIHKGNKPQTPSSKKKSTVKRLSFHIPEFIEENVSQISKECIPADNADMLNNSVQVLDTADFPLLDNKIHYHCNKHSAARSRGSYETRQIFPPKLSQKQRKKEKKSSVSEEIVASPPKTHFKGWATIPPLRESSVINSFHNKKTEPNLFEIISNEQKEKDNWKKMKCKSFHLTQIEDAAMDDLIAFYNANNVFDERITVERVLPLNIAQPVWIPGHKKKAYEEF
ncbi:inhibitor of Bruton tyrosine kinase [Rhodnius prolixus]